MYLFTQFLSGWPLTELNSDPAGGYRLLRSICSRLTTGYPFASAVMSGRISANRSSKNSQQMLRDSPSTKKLSLSTKQGMEGQLHARCAAKALFQSQGTTKHIS